MPLAEAGTEQTMLERLNQDIRSDTKKMQESLFKVN